MSNPVLWLGDTTAENAALVGAKAAALARMKRVGLPVPDGFALTTDVFVEATAAFRVETEARLGKLVAGGEGLEAACRAVRDRVLSIELPPKVTEAIADAMATLGARAVCVRSSATEEDLPEASFAGLYETYLNVLSTEAVIRHVLDVWASFYSPHLLSYKLQRGISPLRGAMAVAVQSLVAAHAAGVLFTRDPLTGAHDRFLVNVALGLGEGLVSGSIGSDRFQIDNRTLVVEERAPSEKSSMIVPRPEGGVYQAEVPEPERHAPALSDDQLRSLGRLAGRVTDLFGGDCDIEFATDKEHIYLLQARPVTSTLENSSFPFVWENPSDPEYTWYLGQGPLYRLQEDALDAYAAGMKRCFEDTGAPMARSHIVRRFNGFQYSRGPSVDHADVDERRRRHAANARLHVRNGTSYYHAEIEPEVVLHLASLGKFRPRKGTSLIDLLSSFEASVAVYGHVMGDLHWRMVAASGLDWPSAYREITGGLEVESSVLVQAIPNRTTQLVRGLRSLAREVQSTPELSAVFHERAFERLEEEPLRSHTDAQRFLRHFRNFLRVYGRRAGHGFGSVAGFAEPTWSMNPHAPLELIGLYARQDLYELDRLEAAARRSRIAATRRLRRRLSSDPERLRRFEGALRQAILQVKSMENHNHLMEQQTVGTLREAIHWMGEGLVRRGKVDDANDVLHLSLGELRELVTATRDDLRSLVRQRKQDLEARSRLRPPRTLGKEGSARPPDGREMYDLPPDVGQDGLLIRGVAASRGYHVGRARVVPQTPGPPQIERGDILVARNAGPAWTPIFPLLGGLVLDQGAVFQHAALVAREYGIPAVVMSRDATKVIEDGQIVAIDGTRGLVDLAPQTAEHL